MTTVSLGVKDTLAKMLDAVPAKKRQFLRARVMNVHPHQKNRNQVNEDRRVVVVDRSIASTVCAINVS